MKPLPLSTVAEHCEGKLIAGDGTRLVDRVVTDSRKVQSGDLFLALVGDKFDAHDFVTQVAQAGAAAVIVSRAPADPLPDCAVILVPDTLEALQNLARQHRRLLNPLVIAITGSNGKTSTKDFTAAVMSRKYQVCATEGNLNNHIGLPLTILGMTTTQNCGVFEMGMNHEGEIALLCSIGEPDAGIITNIGVAHIENLGSREAIASEKGTLAACVPQDGLVVLNANDEFTSSISRRSKARIVTAGIGCGDVRAIVHESDETGSRFELNFSDGSSVETHLPVPGQHMVANATLAAACAWHYGVPPLEIADALRSVNLTKGRMQVKRIRGVMILDDSYNANPDSMRAGLNTLGTMNIQGRKVAVLGRMGELGSHAAQGHREVGECAAACGLDAVFTIGDEAVQISNAAAANHPAMQTRNFSSHVACATFLREWLKDGDAVLLKGSRSAGMEQVLTHFASA
ncbi:MAG: UDP-N-acetylmuramoyl-tripeptide--D-alanyl-D-alanine ligase [Verrucomicrobia bacterium]|nr:UDP-N-acetylmuramoyl-tripeptide--D-alanyl-D-alanine ligase [Verrucomicrobiota bacterium]